MDWNDVRALFSVIMFALLVGIYIWAWSKNRKTDFNEAANLPFAEPEYPAPSTNSGANLNRTGNMSGERI